jgi:hypothetical protein
MAKRYNFLTRCLAAVALLFVYVVGTSAILVGTTTTPAQARGRGGFGYRGGGFVRGRGLGYRGFYAPRAYYGYGYVAPRRCWWDPYYGTVCRRAYY